jgi:hypothetical protein
MAPEESLAGQATGFHAFSAHRAHGPAQRGRDVLHRKASFVAQVQEEAQVGW